MIPDSLVAEATEIAEKYDANPQSAIAYCRYFHQYCLDNFTNPILLAAPTLILHQSAKWEIELGLIEIGPKIVADLVGATLRSIPSEI